MPATTLHSTLKSNLPWLFEGAAESGLKKQQKQPLPHGFSALFPTLAALLDQSETYTAQLAGCSFHLLSWNSVLGPCGWVTAPAQSLIS
jgi:hypothetical protein